VQSREEASEASLARVGALGAGVVPGLEAVGRAPAARPEAPIAPRKLRDSLGRDLHYLRLSVTERCNFHCEYCLPEGCSRLPGGAPLTLAEVGRLLDGFARVGFRKVRITGGEPTLRRDVVEVVRRAVATPGVQRVGLTTNGLRLAELARDLHDAGLSTLNVSLDSLDEARFQRITGSSGLHRVVAGIEAALRLGIPSVKVNVVLLADLTRGEVDRFLAWTRHAPITVRFIELMETGSNRALFERARLPAARIHDRLLAGGWKALPRDGQEGPATIYERAGHVGRAGLIAAYGDGFCASCNRLRVSATGDLRLCLYGRELVPLRPLLQRDGDLEALAALIAASVQRKPASHQLRERLCGTMHSLAAIGG
jgi:GTP 3',8-cyclase